VAAGEEIDLARRRARPELSHLRRDFWLIDEVRAALLRYDGDDRYLDGEITSDPSVIDRLCLERDLALGVAASLADFNRQREQGFGVA
jgi:hypothetical protein